MIMRITWGKVKPGKWDEYEQVYREVVAKRRGTKGLRSRWLVQDTSDRNAGYAVSLWESAEDLKAYEESALLKQIYEDLQPFFTGEFSTSRYDVKVAESFD